MGIMGNIARMSGNHGIRTRDHLESRNPGPESTGIMLSVARMNEIMVSGPRIIGHKDRIH